MDGCVVKLFEYRVKRDPKRGALAFDFTCAEIMVKESPQRYFRHFAGTHLGPDDTAYIDKKCIDTLLVSGRGSGGDIVMYSKNRDAETKNWFKEVVMNRYNTDIERINKELAMKKEESERVLECIY